MCRYGLTNYKSHYICIKCRKGFKEQSKENFKDTDALCPQCREPMISIGKDFRVPPKSNLKQWAKVEKLLQNGVSFHSCGCGVGERPKRLNQVDDFLAERERKDQFYTRKHQIERRAMMLMAKRQKAEQARVAKKEGELKLTKETAWFF